VPAAFVRSVLLTLLAARWVAAARVPGVVILGTYLAVPGVCVLVLGWRHGVRVALAAAGVFPVLHVCYGCGFLRGAWALLARSRRAFDLSSTPLSR